MIEKSELDSNELKNTEKTKEKPKSKPKPKPKQEIVKRTNRSITDWLV